MKAAWRLFPNPFLARGGVSQAATFTSKRLTAAAILERAANAFPAGAEGDLRADSRAVELTHPEVVGRGRRAERRGNDGERQRQEPG